MNSPKIEQTPILFKADGRTHLGYIYSYDDEELHIKTIEMRQYTLAWDEIADYELRKAI